MGRWAIGALLAAALIVTGQPSGATADARAANSLSCVRPDFANPGQYDTKTGLNIAQKLAIRCARKVWAVTSTQGGQCVCFAEILMGLIGADQVKYVAPPSDAGPRWAWVTRNKRIDQWAWNKRPTGLGAPYVLWWNNVSEPRGHVAVYIGKTRSGKDIYIDNLSRPDRADGSRVGYWVVGESMFIQRKVPQGVTRNFLSSRKDSPPVSCRK